MILLPNRNSLHWQTLPYNKLGKVDILVNNAGGGGPKPFDMPMADFRRAYELNVFSFFHLSQLVAPEMEKNGGGVIDRRFFYGGRK